jgi:glucosamine kinase
MAEPLFLGIDAGGSSTVCLAGDLRSVLGRGEAGPANPNLVGVAGFRDAVQLAVAAARRATAPGPPVSTWVGVAGSELARDRDALRAAATEVVGGGEVVIGHDARLLLAAAGIQAGIALVAGTGSSVHGRDAAGDEASVGGWGFVMGDEGSGYDIARRALWAVARAADGRGPATALTEALLAELDARDVAGLRARVYPPRPVPRLAGLAAVVLRLAPSDPVAADIVDAAGRELAAAVEACRRRLGTLDEPIPVVAAGGLLGAGSPLFSAVERCLAAPTGRYNVRRLESEPATGALALARRAAQGTNEVQTQEEQS